MKKVSIFSKIDKPLLIMCILYSVIGAVMVLSASSVSAVLKYDSSPYYFFKRQTIFILFSYFIGFFFILRYPIKRYSKFLFLGAALVLGLLVFLLIGGNLVNSARSWINLGFASIQPSEFAKTIIILFMAIYYGKIIDKKGIKYEICVPLIYAIIVFILVAMQPDLGTALIIAGLSFLIFLAVPFKNNKLASGLKIAGIVASVLLIIFIVTGSNLLNEMQKGRLTYKNPCTRYTEDTGYQVCNGFIAINNGGLFGKGLGNSSQKYLYLPEAHTDFIFPIMVEELGLVFSIFFILGYMFILYRIFRIAKQSVNLRNSIICYGVGIYMFLHIIVNFLGILAVIPLTGVPVPFLSYGGSFTVNLILCMFIVERVAVENKVTKTREEIKNMSAK